MMVMKSFDLKRFLNVAHWDLNINRQAYSKYGMMTVGVYVLITVYTYLTNYCVGDGSNGCVFNDAVYTVGIAMTACSIFSIQTLVVMNSMFHGIHSRQGRIRELTLPATNFEKFCWHVVRTVGFNVLTFVVGVLLADVLHCLFVWLAYGFGSDISSIAARVFGAYVDFSLLLPDLHEGVSAAGVMTVLSGNLLAYAFVSTFALGSAWKYHRSFATTVLYHIAFWLAVVTVFMVSFTLLAPVIGDSVPDIIVFLGRSQSWHWALLLLVVSVSVFAGVWYSTYRLYCGAQITTRRNP